MGESYKWINMEMDCFTYSYRKNIYIKNKKANLARWIHEVILRFRCQLIDEKVAALQSDTAEDIGSHHVELLEEIVQYHKLKTVLSGRLNRVV